jgi:opacity protein-like surface antigen
MGLAGASAQTYVEPAYGPPPADYGPGNDYGFYLNGDVGPSFIPDFQSSRFGFPGSFSARPGVRAGLEPGFNFVSTDSLALGAEFESGIIYNYLYRIDNAGAPTSLRGDYYQVPVLGNLVLRLHTGIGIVPYIGVGGGGDYSSARIHNPGIFHSDTWDDEFDPAVQAMAGVHFRLNPVAEVGFGYKYLADFPDEGWAVATHAVEASFRVRF